MNFDRTYYVSCFALGLPTLAGLIGYAFWGYLQAVGGWSMEALAFAPLVLIAVMLTAIPLAPVVAVAALGMTVTLNLSRRLWRRSAA